MKYWDLVKRLKPRGSRSALLSATLGLGILLATIGCENEVTPPEPEFPPPPGERPPNARLIRGTVSVPSGSLVAASDLVVSSAVSEARTDDNGRFSVYAFDSDVPSFLFLTTGESNLLFLAVSFPGDTAPIQVNLASTANALVLANAAFTGASGADYRAAYGSIDGQPGLSDLVSRLDIVLRSPNEIVGGLLSDGVLPEVYERTSNIAEHVLRGAGTTTLLHQEQLSSSVSADDPELLRDQTGVINVRNPDVVYRGVHVTDALTGNKEPGDVLTSPATLVWRLWWPPVTVLPTDNPIGLLQGPKDVWVSSGLHGERLLVAENLTPLFANLGRSVLFGVRIFGKVPSLGGFEACVAEAGISFSGEQIDQFFFHVTSATQGGDALERFLDFLADAGHEFLSECSPEIIKYQFGKTLTKWLANVLKVVLNPQDITEAGLFVRDWLIEDNTLLRDPAFPGGLGGTYVQRYCLMAGSGLMVSRGAAVWVDWTPEVGAQVVFDQDIYSVAGPPMVSFGVGPGHYFWRIASPGYASNAGGVTVDATTWYVHHLTLTPESGEYETIAGTYAGSVSGLSNGRQLDAVFTFNITQSSETLGGNYSISGTLDGLPVTGTGSLSGRIAAGTNPEVNITSTSSDCPNFSNEFNGRYDGAQRIITLTGTVHIFSLNTCTLIAAYPNTVINFIRTGLSQATQSDRRRVSVVGG